MEQLCNNNIITIPSGEDNRCAYFTDPLVGILKSIFIIICDTVVEYDASKEVVIDITSNKSQPINIYNPSPELQSIYNKLQIKGGKIGGKDGIQIPQHNMLVKYLTGHENVLEIGGNIGRNTLIIAHILQQKNNNNLVVLESCKPHIIFLHINKILNNFHFHIEESAFSKRRLIQNNDTSDIIVSNEVIDGYNFVNIISFTTLKEKYNIMFDTLVLDCVGMFYYILQDIPKLLNKINLIIMTNDYNDVTHKEFINNFLKQKNFYLCYTENGSKPNFYEVWKKS
jgi:hypothetical protein